MLTEGVAFRDCAAARRLRLGARDSVDCLLNNLEKIMHQLMKKHLILAAIVASTSSLVSYSLSAADTPRAEQHETGSKLARAANSTAQFFGDAAITTSVKARLIGDDLTKARHIKVETRDGVVTLSGQADSNGEVLEAEAVTHAVEGVQSIKNELKLKTP